VFVEEMNSFEEVDMGIQVHGVGGSR